MRIGTDIDGVSGDFTKSWTAKYKQWFGRNPGPAAYTSWDGIITATHFEDEKSFFKWTDRASVWADMPVVPGAQGALAELHDLGHQITFLTSRHDSIQAVTNVWVREHFGFLKADVKFTGLHKATAACSVYIDDNPEVLEKLHAGGKQAITFDRHWNRGVETWARAKSWADILTILKGI